MTSQRVERTWIRTGGYRRFRGEWVKHKLKLYFKMLLQVYSQFSLELSQLDAKAKFLKCYVDSAHIFLSFNII